MLHDIERNELYRKAIEKTVKHMLENGQQVDVLDIGTGTGLLAMFACKVDKSVKARGIEVFPPVAKIARKCIAKNGLMKQIEVIETRNTDLEETERKSNLIVTELFDTELIGEGCLESYSALRVRKRRQQGKKVKHIVMISYFDFFARFHGFFYIIFTKTAFFHLLHTLCTPGASKNIANPTKTITCTRFPTPVESTDN